ncbi:MAG: ZIP family metal transporter, partial [Candidatus Thermoplasmatota archaeon]|nr:ZIP family metal transporter [Candidatus Thermoplasmatota archaeon]
MELAQREQTATWRATWLAQAHAHPYTSVGLGLALAVVAWLLLASIWRVAAGGADTALRLGLLGGLAGFAATAAGALPALFLRSL